MAQILRISDVAFALDLKPCAKTRGKALPEAELCEILKARLPSTYHITTVHTCSSSSLVASSPKHKFVHFHRIGAFVQVPSDAVWLFAITSDSKRKVS